MNLKTRNMLVYIGIGILIGIATFGVWWAWFVGINTTIDNLLLFFLISMGAAIVAFIVYFVVVGEKFGGKPWEIAYSWAATILSGAAWVFPIIVNYFIPIVDWYVYIYALVITFALFGVYYFTSQVHKLHETWEDNYGDENGWVKPVEAERGEMGIIKYNGPELEGKLNDHWNIIAPLEILKTPSFPKFYQAFKSEDSRNTKRPPPIEGPPKKTLQEISLYINEKTDKDREVYNYSMERIIEDLKSIPENTDIRDREYMFACRLYFWESRSINKKAHDALRILDIVGFVTFALLYAYILKDQFINFPFTNIAGFLPTFYRATAFSLMFFVGIYAGITATILVGFRQFGINLKFPLSNELTGDPIVEQLGNFAITIALINGIIYGLGVPFLFSSYQSNLLGYILILSVTSGFILAIFFLNMYGPHKLIVNTKKVWIKKFQELLADKENYEGKPEIYERYLQNYKAVLNLREWTIAPPILVKLVSSIFLPFIGYLVNYVAKSLGL